VSVHVGSHFGSPIRRRVGRMEPGFAHQAQARICFALPDTSLHSWQPDVALLEQARATDLGSVDLLRRTWTPPWSPPTPSTRSETPRTTSPDRKKKVDGDRRTSCSAGQPAKLQAAVFGAVQEDSPRDPDYTELDRSHGKIIRRSVWVANANGIDFPHVRQVVRIRPTATTPTARGSVADHPPGGLFGSSTDRPAAHLRLWRRPVPRCDLLD
jgi:hypothetical protein